MKLPDGLTIQTYKSFSEMSPSLHKSVRQMSFDMDTGHLRELATGKDHALVSCAVLFRNDKPVGWAAYYYPYYKTVKSAKADNGYASVSMWVKANMRGRGLGRILIDYAWNRWQRYNPEVYNSVEEKWRAKRAGYDNTHKARVATLKRKGKISPNASVTVGGDTSRSVLFDDGWW